ncbi:cadherin-like domain-containing protein, partial [Sulfurospirillum arcachonense]|uniref:cadherin-like domain-containing protein n=1 Tax=Sulfurospirillum arcachonense TaxID=57666 RepID=UPI00056BEA60
MSKVIGIVKEIIGTIKVTTEDGAVKILSMGDQIHENDIIDAMVSSQATITLNNGKEVIIDGDTSTVLTDEYINSFTPEVAVTSTDNDIKAVEDLLANDEEGTAAGQEGAVAGGLGSAYYHDRLNFGDDGYELDRTEFQRTSPLVDGNNEPIETIIPTAQTTSTVVVSDVNDGPTITADNSTTDEDTSVTVAFTPADVDGTIVSTTATVPAEQGTVVVNADNTYTFTPAENFNGDATITLTTTDDDGATAQTTSTVVV